MVSIFKEWLLVDSLTSPDIYEFLLKSNLDACYITEVYKPSLAAGEKMHKKASQPCLVLAMKWEADTTSVNATLVHEAMAASDFMGRVFLYPAASGRGYDPPFILTFQ